MMVQRVLMATMLAAVLGCESGVGPGVGGERPLDPQLVAEGQQIFRFDTFGDEVYWTDTLRMHEAIAAAVSPATALQVGLKVDVDALPAAVKAAIAAVFAPGST